MDFITTIGNILTAKEIGHTILASFMKKRAKLLQEVILSEIRQGDFSRVHEDDIIAICYRLTRDTMEGVARNNLRLMARLICGLNEKEELTGINFQKYAKILADLTQEEIEFLAALYLRRKQDNERGFVNRLEEEKGVNVIYSLLRTGFFIQDTIQMRDNKTIFLISPFLQYLYDLYNWEDVATWDIKNK